MAPSFSRSGNQMVSLAASPRARPGRARLLALAVHRVGEGRLVDADAARLQRVLRQVQREAIGVVQRERGVAVEHVALLQAGALLVEDGKATLQRLAEAGLFQPQRFLDQVFRAHQVRIGLAHLAHQRPDEPMHQRLLGAEQLRMAHRAAHDPAQHIAAALVRRQHAVGDEEGRRAQMIGDDAERADGLLARVRGRARTRWHRSGGGTDRSRTRSRRPAGCRPCAPAPCRCRSRDAAAARAAPSSPARTA